jgi:hypothetical protein
MPNAKPVLLSRSGCTHSAFCSSVPYASMSSTPTWFETIECSFWRSQWRPEPLRRQVLADDRHAEVRAVAAAVRLRQRIAIEPGVVRHLPDRGEERLPLVVR